MRNSPAFDRHVFASSQDRWSVVFHAMRMISTQICWQDPCWSFCKLWEQEKKRIFVSVNLFRTGFWVISIGMAVGSVLRIAWLFLSRNEFTWNRRRFCCAFRKIAQQRNDFLFLIALLYNRSCSVENLGPARTSKLKSNRHSLYISLYSIPQL